MSPILYPISDFFILPCVTSSLRYPQFYNLYQILYSFLHYLAPALPPILYPISYHTFFPALSLACSILDPISYLLFFPALSLSLYPILYYFLIFCIIPYVCYLGSYILSFVLNGVIWDPISSFLCYLIPALPPILYPISCHILFPLLSLPCVISDPITYLLFFPALSMSLYPISYIIYRIIHSSLRYLFPALSWILYPIFCSSMCYLQSYFPISFFLSYIFTALSLLCVISDPISYLICSFMHSLVPALF